MPWEDVVVGALVMESGVGTYTHHDAFKTGFQGCGPETVSPTPESEAEPRLLANFNLVSTVKHSQAHV